MSEQIKWNFEEFTTYLLLYASNADMEISEAEETLIKRRIPESNYEKIKSEFDIANDYQRIQTILNYKGLYFPTEVQARELIDKVIALFNADGDFSRLEENCMRLLKRLF